jgi:hypothetical protein
MDKKVSVWMGIAIPWLQEPNAEVALLQMSYTGTLLWAFQDSRPDVSDFCKYQLHSPAERCLTSTECLGGWEAAV